MTIALLERGRRAVYHALSRVLSDHAALLHAFEVWEERFAHPHGFRVNLYVNALAEGLHLEASKLQALSSAIYAAMTMPEEKLPTLPAAMRSMPRAAAPTASLQSLSANPRLAIFSTLVAAVTEGVGRLNRLDDFIAALASQQPRLSPASLRARTTWIRGELTDLEQFTQTVDLAERRVVLNDLYLALCEACGPVDADAVLAAAVRATERIPDAQVYSPRQLL